jgi:hypothetical protein
MVKVRAVLLHANEAQNRGGGRGITLPLFATRAQLLFSAIPQPLYPRIRDPVPMLQLAGLAVGLVWIGTKNFALTGV